MSSFVSMIFSFGIVLLTFGATYWPEFLGVLSASPGIPFFILALAFAMVVGLRKKPIYNYLRLSLTLWLPIISSFISLLIFGWDGLYAYKFVSLCLLSTIWLSPLLLADYIKIEHIKSASLIGFAICMLAFIFSDLLDLIPVEINSIIFSNNYLEHNPSRARGFMEESSVFAITTARFALIYYLIWESSRQYSVRRLLLFFIGMAFFLLLFNSKGAVLSCAIAILSASVGRNTYRWTFLLAPIVWLLVESQFQMLISDYSEFTSIATRSTLFLAGFAALLVNPIGWGYYGFYGVVKQFGGWAMNFLNQWVPLRFDEVLTIVDDMSAVSLKSTLIDFSVVYGWFFIWLLVKILRGTRFSDPRVRMVWIFLIASSISTSGHMSISFFLVLAILLRTFPISFISLIK